MEENKHIGNQNNSQKQIVGAILVVGVLIAGAILLKGNKQFELKDIPASGNEGVPVTILAPVGKEDKVIGDPQAKITLILYEDFQCPFCAAVSGLVSDTDAIKYLKKVAPNWTPFMLGINDYVKNGDMMFVPRDYAFLGPESVRAAEAVRCAGDQNEFWEYREHLYARQNGENQGNFSDPRLKSFAKDLNLDTASFNKCLEENKYAQAVIDSKTQGNEAGVTGTPKGFLLRNGKIFATIDGAESFTTVKQKIDNALK